MVDVSADMIFEFSSILQMICSFSSIRPSTESIPCYLTCSLALDSIEVGRSRPDADAGGSADDCIGDCCFGGATAIGLRPGEFTWLCRSAKTCSFVI